MFCEEIESRGLEGADLTDIPDRRGAEVEVVSGGHVGITLPIEVESRYPHLRKNNPFHAIAELGVTLSRRVEQTENIQLLCKHYWVPLKSLVLPMESKSNRCKACSIMTA